MTKTEELVMNFITEHEKKNGPNMPMNSAELLSLVEAAERRRTEEVIEAAHQWFDPSSPEHHMAKIGSSLKKFLVRKFLKNPEQ